MGSGNYIPKIVSQMVADICERNNITMTQLAGALGVTSQTAYNWRSGKTAFPEAHVLAVEAQKCAAGEWPIPGPTHAERLRAMRLEQIAKMNEKRAKCPDWRERMKAAQAATRVRLGKHLMGRYCACKRNWEEVRQSELADGHVITFTTFYQQSRKRTDARNGYVYEGRKKIYCFE